MDMMGEISLRRLRGKGGEVELCSAAIHYLLHLITIAYFSIFFLILSQYLEEEIEIFLVLILPS